MPLNPRLRRFIRRELLPIALVVLVTCCVRSAIADWNIVPTGSMNPSIIEGDRIFVNKLAYGLRIPFTEVHLAQWSTPSRGDVITFCSPKDGTTLVKRVIGLPGDTVAMENERLLINGVAADYAPATTAASSDLPAALQTGHQFASEQIPGAPQHEVMATPSLRAMRSFGPITVPADHYFVLGDNRDNSADSRYIGAIPLQNIYGRSSRVILSFDPATHLPRWGRTFEAISR